MKKRVFAFFIVLSMAVLLCACQGKDQKDSDIQITDTAQQESVTGRKQNEVAKTLEMLEDIWDEYQVYENDEINYIDDSIKMRYGKIGDTEFNE